jgi:uncharacterized protein YidB (DUF937 family)
MGLLDQLTHGLSGKEGASSDQLGGLGAALVRMLSDRQSGGFQGLIDAFQRNGLGDVVGSWISPGQNTEISESQLEQVLGRDRVDDLTRQAGLSPQQGRPALAALLPQLIDKLTPDGHAPDDSQLGSLGSQLLSALRR